MIKILLCCGGGFSSSAIAQRMQKEIEKIGKQDEYAMTFYPFSLAVSENKIDEYDVVICCPHLKISVQRAIDEHQDYQTPIYLLPPRIYGNMRIEEILMDVNDVIKIFKVTHQNPIHFPGEENLLRIQRNVAFRHEYPNKEIF